MSVIAALLMLQSVVAPVATAPVSSSTQAAERWTASGVFTKCLRDATPELYDKVADREWREIWAKSLEACGEARSNYHRILIEHFRGFHSLSAAKGLRMANEEIARWEKSYRRRLRHPIAPMRRP